MGIKRFDHLTAWSFWWAHKYEDWGIFIIIPKAVPISVILLIDLVMFSNSYTDFSQIRKQSTWSPGSVFHRAIIKLCISLVLQIGVWHWRHLLFGSVLLELSSQLTKLRSTGQRIMYYLDFNPAFKQVPLCSRTTSTVFRIHVTTIFAFGTTNY